MKILVHISDLHFGTEITAVKDALAVEIRKIRPDLLIVSGDLTQRARRAQFKAARAFLDTTEAPWFSVPGNHDIPLFDFVRRIAAPLDRYYRYITAVPAPFWTDGRIAVVGINTARVLTWKNGRISEEQMQVIRERFCAVHSATFKILVTHHPLLPPPGRREASVVGRAARMLVTVEECSPDLALAGHLHESYSGETHAVYKAGGGSTLVIQAGTAISGRIRAEPNAFNQIQISGEEVRLAVMMWNGRSFQTRRVDRFRREAGVWRSTSPIPEVEP